MSKDELTTQPYTNEDAKDAVTAFDVGLGNVDNKALANVQFSDLQATRYTDSEARSAVSASDVGLGNVPNTDATNPSNLDTGSASDGDVLQVSSGTPSFVSISTGGPALDLNLLESGTENGISEIVWAGGTGITSKGKYIIVARISRPARLRFFNNGSFIDRPDYEYRAAKYEAKNQGDVTDVSAEFLANVDGYMRAIFNNSNGKVSTRTAIGLFSARGSVEIGQRVAQFDGIGLQNLNGDISYKVFESTI